MRKKLSLNPIRESDDNPIFIGVCKFVIKKDPPDSLHNFSSQVGKDVSCCHFTECLFVKILDGIIKLEDRQNISEGIKILFKFYLWDICQMVCGKRCWFCTDIL